MGRAPVRVITVEREYGSHGGEFAHDLAERLGWRLLDSELVTGAAHAAGVSPELAARFDERLDPWYYRYGKVFWQDSIFPTGGVPEEKVFDCERMMGLIRQQIVDAAKTGNCVLVGRGAACALACQPGCFHVFVYATAKFKRDWFAATFPNKADQADQMLSSMDKSRAAVIRQYYKQEWCARGLYHLLLNSCLGLDAMIDAVAGAAGLKAAATQAVAS